MMNEVHKRPLKFGVLVIDACKKAVMSDQSYGIVVGESHIFKASGRRVATELVYLVENPCEAERKILEKLTACYNKSIIDNEKRRKELKEKNKERNLQRKALVYNIGDILQSETDKGVYKVYLGKVKVTDEQVGEAVGYGYITLYDHDFTKLPKGFRKDMTDIDVFDLEGVKTEFTRLHMYKSDKVKSFLTEIYKFNLLKKKTFSFDSVIGHIGVGTGVTGTYIMRAGYYSVNRDVNYRFSVQVLHEE